MAALKKYHTSWKAKMASFERSLYQVEAAYTNGDITNVVHGKHQLAVANVMWTGIEEAYAMYKVDYPEPESLELEPEEDARIYQERQEYFDRSRDAQTIFSLEA